MREVTFGGTYRHFKGDYYLVLFMAIDAETGRRVVVYQSLSTGIYHTRDEEEFLSPTDKEKYPSAIYKWRFVEV